MIAIVLAGALSLILTLVGTRLEIAWLHRRQYGQFIRDDGPTTHKTKRGTPTMGGLAIIFAVIVTYVVVHLVFRTPPSPSGLLVLFLFAGTGFVGFLDDWIKISRERSLGLHPRGKMLGQVLVGVTFGVLALILPADARGNAPASTHISFLRDLPFASLEFGGLLWVGVAVGAAWIVLLTVATSNAVNLTDGLDGLVPGSATMVFAAYTLINIWQSGQSCSNDAAYKPRCYEVPNPNDLAIISVALAGACFAFLWWNARPAQIFLGDTGSLSLGGAMAGLAICTRTELLLVVLGGLYVMETMSDILQVGYFKATKGKRLFKMAPIHHHFELLGWAEVTVVTRFWIIAGLCVAVSLAIFYAEWVVGW